MAALVRYLAALFTVVSVLVFISCQEKSKIRDPSSIGALRDQVPRETARELLPHLTELDLPNYKFLNEDGQYVPVTHFVEAWAPYHSTLFGAWRAVAENVKYDKYKLYTRWYAQSPAFTWRHRRGICIDTAILLCAWLLKEGENAFVALGDTGEVRSGHAWVVVRDSSKKETLLLETAIDASLPPSIIRKLPREEAYRIHALFNDKHIFVADQYRQEVEQYFREISR
jgi:hypothetical protein